MVVHVQTMELCHTPVAALEDMLDHVVNLIAVRQTFVHWAKLVFTLLKELYLCVVRYIRTVVACSCFRIARMNGAS